MGVEVTDQIDDDGQQSNSGGGLRKQLEQTLERLKGLESENATLKTQARTAAISGVLTEKKYPAKVAKLIPSDVEATPEAVQKWLDEYGDVFNIQKDAAAGGGETAGDTETQVDPEDFEQTQQYIHTMRQMGAINGGLLPPAKAQELLAKINSPDLKPDELLTLITQHGGGYGMG